MRHLLLISAALIALSQDPPRVQDPKDFKPIDGWAYDSETGDVFLEFSGYGHIDQNQGTGSLTRIRVRYDTKATEDHPAQTIHVFANRCAMTGYGREEGDKKTRFQFTEGLKVLLGNDVQLWTTEGTLEAQSKVLKCPGRTHLVQYKWPTKIDLASALVFMDPVDLRWLRLFGAPEPDLELVGDDFVFDAAAGTYTAARNGRIRVKGSPGDAIKPVEPTELQCEGPLRLRNLGPPDADAWPALHVTAEKRVVIEHRTKVSVTRTHSDSASFYIATPPKKTQGKSRLLSAVLSGRVRIEESSGFSATADRVEWNHQDGLMRMTGVPRVRIVQGDQILVAREVIVDQVDRTIDFKGDIAATFRSSEGSKNLMTLTPGSLRIPTDAKGRPTGIHARHGVRLSSGGSASAPGALEAQGTEFEWDLITGEGVLRGAPFARIQQGFNVVIAPLVSFRGDTVENSIMTVKGPKLMKFFAELDPPPNAGRDLLDSALGLPGLANRPSEPTLNSSASLLEAALGLPGFQKIPDRRTSVMDFTITCDGDVEVDQNVGIVKLVDRCQVRAQDSTLNADRLFVYLKEKKSIDRVIGSGNVVAFYSVGPKGGPLRVHGETFEMKRDSTLGPKGRQVVTIVGHPTGRLQYAGSDAPFERMCIYLEDRTFWLSKGSLPLKF